MPLSHEFDRDQLAIALVSGMISSFFHWAALQTSERETSLRQVRGQMIAAFASGIVSVWFLGLQSLVSVDPLGAFCVAAAVGFVYGPSGLVVAARMMSQKANVDDAGTRQLETQVIPVGRQSAGPVIAPSSFPAPPVAAQPTVAPAAAPALGENSSTPSASPYDLEALK